MWRVRALRVFLLTVTILLLAISYSMGGSVPQLINYQGTLTDKSGSPVPNGNYDMVFNIYDVASGGTALWTETWNSTTGQIAVVGGVFNAMLGAHTPLPATFFSDHSVAYLGIKVGTDSEMLPRQQITSVGYAFTAANGVPKGGIIMWSGAVNQIPDGWALCNGQNGTPDLRDRFVLGAGNTYGVGVTGGEASHVLTRTEMPSHTHVQNAHTHIQDPHGHTMSVNGSDGTTRVRGGGTGTQYSPIGLGVNQNTATNQSATATNQNTGDGMPHNTMPPYFALAFIMKL